MPPFARCRQPGLEIGYLFAGPFQLLYFAAIAQHAPSRLQFAVALSLDPCSFQADPIQAVVCKVGSRPNK